MTLFNEQMAELLALRASVKSLGEKLEASQARIELLEHDAKTGDYETLYAQTLYELEASQAREAQLREGIEYILNTATTIEGAKAGCSILLLYPADDTTLKAGLKAERERCAKAFSQWDRDGRWAAGVIRNLGDET